MTPNKQPADSQISAVLAEELADVEASAETRDIGQQLLSSCFRFLRRLLVVGLGVYLLMLACLAFFENRILYQGAKYSACLLYTSPSPRDGLLSRMPSSA